MAIGKKIRIYDLAREVKQDAKRVMEDLRREGADVSVASNSVSAELAEKVRLKYFPKTEVAPKRAIKVIKKASKAKAKPEAETEAEETAPDETPAIAEEPAVEAKPKTKRLAKKAEPVAEEAVEAKTVEPAEEKADEEPVKAKKRVVTKKAIEASRGCQRIRGSGGKGCRRPRSRSRARNGACRSGNRSCCRRREA